MSDIPPVPACDPLMLDSHDWKPFRQTLLKCARLGCGLVITRMLFERFDKPTRAYIP